MKEVANLLIHYFSKSASKLAKLICYLHKLILIQSFFFSICLLFESAITKHSSALAWSAITIVIISFSENTIDLKLIANGAIADKINY